MAEPIRSKDCVSLRSLRLHVYVVGYPMEGEAILFLFEENSEPLLTILTDSYRDDDYCHISKILSDWGSPNLDMFFWTHPDNDHSKGIETLLGEFDKNGDCHIFIPHYLHSENVEEHIGKNATGALTYLKNNYNRSPKYAKGHLRQYHPVSFDVSADPARFNFEFRSIVTGGLLGVSIEIYGPEVQRVLQHTDGTLGYDANTMSIVYKMNANSVNLFMTGDLDNEGAGVIPDECFKNIHFLKIPHHGSDELKDFTGKFVMNETADMVSATTVFNHGKKPLPVDDMIGDYKEHSSAIYSTGVGEAKFGCVHVTYNLMKVLREGEVELAGNALAL